MNIELHSLAWPASRLGEAIEIVARKAYQLSNPVPLPQPPKGIAEADLSEIEQWLRIVAGQLELEVEGVTSPYHNILDLVRHASPALLRLPRDVGMVSHAGVSGQGFLVLLSGGGKQVKVLTPHLSVRRVKTEVIRAALTREIEAPHLSQIDQLLAEAGVPAARRVRAKRAILNQQLSSSQIGACFLLRLSPTLSFWQHLRRTKSPRHMVLMIVGFTIQQLLGVAGGWLILQGALQGYFDWGWLLAWALILFTTLPFQLFVFSLQILLTTKVGELFKKRLLFGCLQLEPEQIRHQGVGQFLGRIMESEAVELLALGGGFAALIALIQLLTAAAVLLVGTKGWFHPLLLLLWTLTTLLVGWRYYRVSLQWVRSYREMTNDLVERMVGHQTRLAQERAEHWHDKEDQILANYLKLSEGMDRWGISLSAFVNRGWLILALAGLVPSFILSQTSQSEIAITLGGIMLASNALNQIANGMTSLIGIMNAWEQFEPLFNFRTKASQLPKEALLSQQKSGSFKRAVILARDLTFRYHEEGQAVLDECDLRIGEGERLLLEGPSGGGKSTLAALLTGLRTPDSGLLLLRGLDYSIIGSQEWRRRVVSAPQFHENHVLTDTFAFNLLMGRRWPPSTSDLKEAEIICGELGLGELLERMPAGMQQMVGESGWQLSHGERSRLYIARALLQQADLIILDESFAALDPENLRRALRCVLKRAPALLVIAHP